MAEAAPRSDVATDQLLAEMLVERDAVGLDIVEPDTVGAADGGLGEDEDRGRDAGVRLEHAAGEGDDGVELLLLDEDLPERPVGDARPEEDAVGDDDGGAAAGLQEPEEEGEEEDRRCHGERDVVRRLAGRVVHDVGARDQKRGGYGED